ncbi:MAG TPA: ROK family protein [Pyrinomonadaceae bacterium]|nr:ROK family protein [Pyrinomonadaceae bacterium]
MTSPYAIGVDLGGTNIKIAAVSHDGDVLEYQTAETADDAEGGAWANTIRQKIDEIQTGRGFPASHIGVASPGLAARDGLSIANMQGRLQGLQGLIWTDLLKSARPIPVLNDAHAALLGEVWKGAAQGFSEVVLLTLGTGVGGAVLSAGRLLKGHLGRAGHLGHISLNPDGGPDIVGTPGSLEEMIGNYNLLTRSKNRFSSTRELVEAHLKGDKDASAIWLRSIHQLAAGITSIINSFDPEVVILGGGISRAGAALFEPLATEMDRIEWRPLGSKVQIIPAALGDLAGPLGAVYNSLKNQ